MAEGGNGSRRPARAGREIPWRWGQRGTCCETDQRSLVNVGISWILGETGRKGGVVRKKHDNHRSTDSPLF